jgi:DnaJ-class molecular chaperone
VVEIDTEGSIVRYGEVRTFEWEGMPIHGTPSEYGNFLVDFIVDFPRRLNENQIDQLKKLLP